MRLLKPFARIFSVSGVLALVLGPLLAPPAHGRHVDGQTNRGHFAAGEGAIQLVREVRRDNQVIFDPLSATDESAFPGGRTTDTTRDEYRVELAKRGFGSANLAGRYGDPDDISSILGVASVIESDVVTIGDTLYLAFVTLSGDDKRRLGVSKWTAANGWQALEGAGRYTAYTRDVEGQELDGVYGVKARWVTYTTDVRDFGDSDALFVYFGDEELGDVYVLRKGDGAATIENLSDNPSLSADFSVSSSGGAVVWMDNQTNAEHGGDAYVRVLQTEGGAFSRAVNITGPKLNRGTYTFSRPRIERITTRQQNQVHPWLLFYVIARDSAGRYFSVRDEWRSEVFDQSLREYEAYSRASVLVLSEPQAEPITRVEVAVVPRALSPWVVMVEDGRGVTLQHLPAPWHLGLRIDGARNTKIVVSERWGTVVFERDGAAFVLNLEEDDNPNSSDILRPRGNSQHPTEVRSDAGSLRPQTFGDSFTGYLTVYFSQSSGNTTRVLRVERDNPQASLREVTSDTALSLDYLHVVRISATNLNKPDGSAVRGTQRLVVWQTPFGRLKMIREIEAIDRDLYAPRGEFVSGKLNTGPEQVRRIELIATQSIGASQSIDYHVSNDGGVTWHAPRVANFDFFNPPNPASRDRQFDFPAVGNDLRVKATLSTGDPFTTPTIRYIHVAYYKVEQNQPPIVAITTARQLPGTDRALIEYTASDPNGARGRLTAEFQGADGVWHVMSYIRAHTHDPQALPIADRPSNFQFMWDLPSVGAVEAPVPIRFQVSDGTAQSAYAERRVPVDMRPPQLANFGVGEATPDTLTVRWDAARDVNLSHYNVFHLRLPFPSLDGRQITCQNVTQEPFTALAVEQARPRSVRNVGNVTSATIQSLFSDTCYVVFLEGYDTFGNHSLSSPSVTRTARPPIPQTPQVAIVSARQATDGLVDIDYTIADGDSRSFTAGGTVSFIDTAGRAQTIALVGDPLNRHSHNGANVSFPDDQPGNSRGFRFVWDSRTELARYAINDSIPVDIVLRAVDGDGMIGVGPQQRVTVDALAPRLDPVAVSDVTRDGARVRWRPAEDANFIQYKLWLGHTAAAARFHPDQFVARLTVINNREQAWSVFEGLQAGRTYYFCLEAFDRAGNQSTSQCGEFTTAAQPANQRPRIPRGAVLSVGETIAFEVLVSDPNGDPVKLFVDYSTDQREWRPAAGFDRNQQYDGYALHSLTWQHRQDLPQHNGDAWLRIVAEDGGRLRSDPSLILGPITIDRRPPQWAGDLTISDITTESARTSWQVADAADLVGYLVRAFNQVTNQLVFSGFTGELSSVLSGLASGTQHMAEVVALDGAGNQVGKTKLFTTEVAQVPIVNPSITINGSAASTKSNVVALALAAQNADEMWVSNDRTFSSGGWQAVAATLRWELLVAGATQERAVYAKFRNGSGTVSPVVTDSINYVPPDDGADADVGVHDDRTVNVVATHDQKPYYGPGDQVRLRAQAVGSVPFDSIRFFVDGRALSQVCATSPCEVVGGPFAPGLHSYWAVIVPRGGNLSNGVRSQAGRFKIERRELTISASVNPVNPYAGRTVELVAVVRAARDVAFNLRSQLNGSNNDLACRLASQWEWRCTRSVELAAGDYTVSNILTMSGVELRRAQYAFTVRPAPNQEAPTMSIVVNPAAPAADQGISVVAATRGNVNYRTITITIDGNRVAQCAGSPCEYFIPAGTLAVGDHTIVARTDGAPPAEARQSITVRAAGLFQPNAPLTAEVGIAPVAPTADGPIVVTVGVDGEFDRIELLVDNQVVETCAELPCTLATQLGVGPHTVVARVTYAQDGVERTVESTTQVVVAPGEPPPPAEEDILRDQAPEGIELVVDPDGEVTVGERVTITARVAGDGLRIERIELFEGTVGEERLVETCRNRTTCSHTFVATIAGVHSVYANASYRLGNEVEERVSDQPLFTVLTRGEAAQEELDVDKFDQENGTAEAEDAGPEGVLVTDSNVVRISSNGANLCFMRFAVDPSFTGAAWAPFDPSYDFSLPAGEGEVIVYLQYKSCSGNESDVYTRRVVRSTAQLTSSDARQAAFGQGGAASGGGNGGGGASADATPASVIRIFSFECSDTSKSRDRNLMNRLVGRILLAVERKGEAFYLFRKDAKKVDETCGYYLGRPTHAFNVMRFLGVGISNQNLGRMFANFTTPRPGDRTVFTARDKGRLQPFAGKILLQVEAKGEAYYVSPVDLKGYYLGRPADAFRVMRELGLGVGNTSLGKIPLFAEILKAKP